MHKQIAKTTRLRGWILPLLAVLCLGLPSVQAATELHRAAAKGDVDTIKYLIIRGADVNIVDDRKETPLHYAARYNRVEAVKCLLEVGADMYAGDRYGYTALDHSIFHNQEAVSDLLITAMDFTRESKFPIKSLHIAVFCESMDILNRLAAKKGIDVNAKDIFGDTPLHDAAFGNNIKAVDILVKNGADVNALNRRKSTPFLKACRSYHNGSIKTMKKLKAYGADVNAQDVTGMSSMHYAIVRKQTEKIDWLLQYTDVDVNAQDNNGCTPTHCAVMHPSNNNSSLKKLISKGADCYIKNKKGEMALDIAIAKKNHTAIKMLRENNLKKDS
ncbi:MAG: ankyrin repeat domain-containing protein [Cytophagales bacterium]